MRFPEDANAVLTVETFPNGAGLILTVAGHEVRGVESIQVVNGKAVVTIPLTCLRGEFDYVQPGRQSDPNVADR